MSKVVNKENIPPQLNNKSVQKSEESVIEKPKFIWHQYTEKDYLNDSDISEETDSLNASQELNSSMSSSEYKE